MKQHPAPYSRMLLPLAVALSLLILMLTPLLPSAFAAAPVITSFTPSTGGTATSVVITGADFDTATAVTFGGTAATSFTVDSSTAITAIVGAGTTGVITVTTSRGTGTSVGTFTFVATPTTIYVRRDGSDANCDGTANAVYPGSGLGLACAKATIQAGVNAVAAGGTVNVGAGSYAEQISVSKSLRFTGAGSGMTTIRAPAVLTNDPDGSKTLVLFTGPITAEFSGFTVAGPVNGLDFGIYVRAGAIANIHDNVIKDIRDEPLSGAQTGVAIQVGQYPYGSVNQIGTATITNNQIFGYQKIGIAVENTGSSATVSGNTVTGIGPTTMIAQNGIQLRRGATGIIKNNVVTGNAWNGPTWSAFGIGVTYPGSGVIVQGNTVNHNSANIYCWESDGVQILGNHVNDSASVDQNKVAGITVQANNAATTSVGLTNIVISGNTVQNNLSGASTPSDGIDLYGIKSATVNNNVIVGSSYDGILIGGSGNITITGNQFSGNGLLVSDSNAAAIDFRGIPARDWSLPLGNGGANPLGGFSVHNNSFVGNHIGIWNYDTSSVDATNNWWGNVSGPGSLTNVSTIPWCTDVACVTKSNNADLTSLSLSSGSLSPAFSSLTTAYSASVDYSATSITISKSTNPGANAVVSGGSNLSVGSNAVSITVTSADDTATKTYTVTIIRAAAIAPTPAPVVEPPVASIETPVSGVVRAGATAEITVSATIERDAGVKSVVSVTIPVGAISTFANISIAPAFTPAEVAAGAVGIKVTATDSAKVVITQFDKPLLINLGYVSASATVAFSQDGIAWTRIQLLSGTMLPAGVQEGYYIAADGRTVILTRHLTYFAIKKVQARLEITSRTATLDVGRNLRVVTSGGFGNGVDGFITATPTICSVSPAGLLSALSAGVCTIQATKAGTGTYFEAFSATISLTIQKIVQRMLLVTANTVTLKVGGSSTLTVKGGSGDGIAGFNTTTPAVCSVSSVGLVTALSAGDCMVVATKGGNGTYLDASSLPMSLTVQKIVQPAAETVTVAGKALWKRITVTFGIAYANKEVLLQIRKAGSFKYVTLAMVTLNNAGRVTTLRAVPTKSTIRVVISGKIAAAIRL